MTLEIWLSSAAYAIVLGVLLVCTARPLLGILQQEGYSGVGLIRWYYRPKNELRRRYALLALTAALATALLALCFSFTGFGTPIALLGYAGLAGLFVYALRRALKVPLKRTARTVRLAVCFYLLVALVLFGIAAGFSALAALCNHRLADALLRPVPLAVVPVLLPLLLSGANAVMQLYERPHTAKFVRAATATIAGSKCIKVGITGSFGKTSVKHYAAELLGTKYRVIKTPLSYNTPVGIAKCVNEGGLDCDVFLAEMGARKRGDIAELADMVCPDVAVITGICPQHLETFGSLEAIEREKGVLAERAQTVILGSSAKGLDRAGALFEGRDFAAENVVLSTDGTSFDLVLGGERAHVETNLLGRHAAEDLALAGALCYRLGMTAAEVAAGARALKPVPHRLERLEGANGVHILDDSYNSNAEGAKNAVEVLRLFAGRQFVVTPGLVELGNLEEAANEQLGEQLAGLNVILVGETLVLSVRQGYLAAGGDEARLRVVPTLAAAQRILADELAPGDAVLFLNDLPDKFS